MLSSARLRHACLLALILVAAGCVPVVHRPSAAAFGAPSASLRLPAGTPVPIQVAGTVGSDPATTFGPPVFVTAAELRDASGQVVVAQGAAVAAVIDSRAARRLGREGWVVVRLQGVQAVDGSWLALAGGAELHGTRRVARAAGLGTGLILVFWLSPLIYLMRGHEVVLPPQQTIVGTIVDAPPAPIVVPVGY